MKKILALAALGLTLAVAGCTDADVVSQNLSKDADQFKIARRVIFYNGITGEYILTIQGLCALGNHDKEKEVTVVCKKGDGYIKEFLGLSDNVTYFAEQLDPADVSSSQFKVVLKPLAIIPSFEIH